MMLDEMRSRIDFIRKIAGIDDEMAHSREDDLHQTVLDVIAKGECDDPQEYAKLALTTLDIKFNRWCA